ncbi:hypothetical protein DOY81_001524, partial [Sarcophaga bullata]
MRNHVTNKLSIKFNSSLQASGKSYEAYGNDAVKSKAAAKWLTCFRSYNVGVK